MEREKIRWILLLIFCAGCSLAFLSVDKILFGFAFEFAFVVFLMTGWKTKKEKDVTNTDLFLGNMERVFK